MNIKEFAQKYIKAQTEAWLKGKVDAFSELEHPDVVYHFQTENQDRAGLEGHKQFLIGINKAFTNTEMNMKYLIGEGNLFAVSYSARGMFTGEFPGAPPPTGNHPSQAPDEIATHGVILPSAGPRLVRPSYRNASMLSR